MNNPLHYFEDLFTTEKSENLKRMMISDRVESAGKYLINVDYEIGTVTTKEFFHDGNDIIENQSTWNFDKNFKMQIAGEITILKKIISDKILELSLEGKEGNIFLNHLTTKFQLYILKAQSLFVGYPFVQGLLSDFIIYLNEQQNGMEPKRLNRNDLIVHPLATAVTTNTNHSNTSFKWGLLNSDDSVEQLKKLYDLLVQAPPLIDCDRQEFINAFTEKEVIHGIRWMLTSVKNRLPSKVSLIYFLKQLMEKSELEEDELNFNRKIEYVFRDFSGQPFKNIKQSKSQISETPYHYERIDELIDLFLASYLY